MKRSLSSSVLILLAGLSCSKRVTQAGGLELMLMSDLPASDLNKVHLEISQETAPGEWHKVFDRDAFVHDPAEISLPSTASIEAGDSPNQGALIVFTGLYGDEEVVQRVVQTEVPTDRVAELKMLLTVPCVGKVMACPVGESCQPQTGECISNKVDSSTLPTYGAADESPGTDLTGGPTGAGGSALAGGGGPAENGGGGPADAGGPTSGGAGRAPGGPIGCLDLLHADGSHPMIPKAFVTSDLLSDFEGAPNDVITAVTPGGHWFSYDLNPEYHNLYSSMFTPQPGDWTVENPGHGGTGNAVHTTGRLNMGTRGTPTAADHWEAGVGFSLGGAAPGAPASSSETWVLPTDVSAYAGISFYAKSSERTAISVQFATTANDPSYCGCAAQSRCAEHTSVITNVAPDWTQYTVRFADLRQPANFGVIPFYSSGLLTIKFASNSNIPQFDFWIDDVTLIH